MTEHSELSAESLAYINSTSIEKRKSLGQYMTPRGISDIVLEHLPLKNGDKVLDPAVGTGELLSALQRKNATLELHGWDIDPEILEVAKKAHPDIIFKERSAIDSLDPEILASFDIVFANPPYFEMKLNDDQKVEFKEVISGRVNIFSLFFQRAIELVKDKGHVAFIVPPSLNAGAFFSSLRQYIMSQSEIAYLEVVRKSSHFIDAQTSVQIIILQKTTNPKVNTDYIFTVKTPKAEVNVFSDNTKFLTDSWVGHQSLYELGFQAVTGTIPWNQYKDSLSKEKVINSHPLIYSKDITSINTLELTSKLEDRRYLLTTKNPIEQDVIIVNRIVGSLDSPSLRAAICRGSEMAFFAENHVNVIQPIPGKAKISIDELFKRILGNKHLMNYIKALTGNTQISANELTYLIPF